ncbi:hypothetical protein V2G26_011044 [Clonostachys chloroleuca]
MPGHERPAARHAWKRFWQVMRLVGEERCLAVSSVDEFDTTAGHYTRLEPVVAHSSRELAAKIRDGPIMEAAGWPASEDVPVCHPASRRDAIISWAEPARRQPSAMHPCMLRF